MAQESKTDGRDEEPLFLTEKVLHDFFDFAEYGDTTKYPYIDCLPFTMPSVEARRNFNSKHKLTYEKGEFKSLKLSEVEEDLPSVSQQLLDYRNVSKKYSFPLQRPKSCVIKSETIANIDCDWIIYDGASMQKYGVIMALHGGGYCMGSTKSTYAECELYSQLTGAFCLSLNYNLTPQTPFATILKQVIDVYKYLLETLKISNKKICIFGDSAGGSMVLLLIQKMIEMNDIPLPCCVECNSPWTHLTLKDNDRFDEKQSLYVKYGLKSEKSELKRKEFENNIVRWVVGKLDENGKENQNVDENVCETKTFSPVFGDFKGFCPTYITVGATEECFTRDIVTCAKKIYEENGKNLDLIHLEVSPYLFHVYPRAITLIPEATQATVRIANWFNKHLNSQK